MAVAALITWIVTALFGATMLVTWLRAGGAGAGTAGGGRAGGFPPAVVFGHFLIAAAGLVVWIVYLVTNQDVLTWVAFVILVVVAGLGDVLVLRWNRSRKTSGVVAGARRAAAAAVDSADPAPERRIPAGLVGAHGVFAVATVVLVLLVALGVGGS